MIDHIMLNVSNLERAISFYDSFLIEMGYIVKHEVRDKFGGAKMYRGMNLSIWLKEDKNVESKTYNRFVGLDHIAFFVKDASWVDYLYSIIKSKDVLITREPMYYPEYSEHYYAFYFRDPDGIPLEIMTK